MKRAQWFVECGASHQRSGCVLSSLEPVRRVTEFNVSWEPVQLLKWAKCTFVVAGSVCITSFLFQLVFIFRSLREQGSHQVHCCALWMCIAHEASARRWKTHVLSADRPSKSSLPKKWCKNGIYAPKLHTTWTRKSLSNPAHTQSVADISCPIRLYTAIISPNPIRIR